MAPRILSPYVVGEQVVTSIARDGSTKDRLTIDTNLSPSAAERSEMLQKIKDFLEQNKSFEGADIRHVKTL